MKLRKKKRFSKVLALTLAVALLPWSSNLAFAETGMPGQDLEKAAQEELPEPAYLWDFESDNVKDGKVSNQGLVSDGDGTLQGTAKTESSDISIGEKTYSKNGNSVLVLSGGTKGSSFVDLPADLYNGVSAETGLTWSFWMKPDAKVESYSRLFSSSNGGSDESHGQEFTYAPFGNDKNWNLLFDEKNAYREIYAVTEPEKSVWSYVTITVSKDEVVFYINGDKCESRHTGETSNLITRLDNLATLTYHALGKTTSTWTDPDCKVQLDDVAIYKTVLTEGQVAALAKSYGLDNLQDNCNNYNYYEAEDSEYAECAGGARIEGTGAKDDPKKAYASGHKVAGWIGGTASDTLTFKNIYAGASGSYKLKIYYISGAKRNLYVKVNDGEEIILENLIGGTNDWDVVASTTVDVSLQQGSNSIVFYNNAAAAPSIDRIAISKLDISDATAAPAQPSYAYTGEAVEADVTVTYNGETLVKDTDYTVSYENNTAEGTAKAIITGIGTCYGTAETTFEIAKTDISAAEITFKNGTTYPHTGSAIKPEVVVDYGDKTLEEEKDYTVSYENNTEAGTNAKVIITGTGIYTGKKEATFTILAQSADAVALTAENVTLAGAEYTYTGSEIRPGVTVTVDGTALIAGTDYTVSYQDNTNAGTATVTVTGMGNYKGTVEKTFTINPKDLTDGAVTLKKTKYLHTGEAIKPPVTVKDGDKVLAAGTDYTVTFADNIAVGTGKATIKGKGNYSGEITKEFTISENTLPKPQYFWDFNSVSGTAVNSSGTAANANATLRGTAKTEQSQITIGDETYGEAEGNSVLVLSGGSCGSSYVDLPASLYSGVTSGTGLTWSFWMKPDSSVGSYTRVFSSSNGGSDGSHGREFAYAPYADDKYWNLIFDDGSQYMHIYGTEPEKAVWNYITVTVSKSEVVFYINGDKCASTIKTGSASLLESRLNELKTFTNHSLGKTNSDWGNPDCKVQLDDVAIYNSVLTEAEVAELARTYGLEPEGPKESQNAGEGTYGTEGKQLTQIENATIKQGKNTVKIWKDADNSYYYSVTKDGKVVIECSAIGLNTKAADLTKGMALDESSIRTTSGTEDYDIIQGSTSHVNKAYKQVSFDLAKGSSKVTMIFRVFDDGMAYRYVVDANTASSTEVTTITEEKSEFMLPDKGTIWTITPSPTYEGSEYTKRNMKDQYDANTKYSTPILASLGEDSGNAWVLLTEANVYNEEEPYCASIFQTKAGSKAMQTTFGMYTKPDANGNYSWSTGTAYVTEVKMTNVFHTPWRAAIIADDLEGVTNSSLVMDLNPDPEEGSDFSWVEPGATVWSWWSTSYDAIQYSTMIDYIDFASEIGMKYCLVDFGWELWDDFRNRIESLVDYANTKGVGLLLWYGVNKFDGTHIFDLNNEETIEEEFAWCERAGVKGVKVDYFNSDRQFVNGMQNMYWIADIAAKHRLVVNYHGCTNPNGENRTYPNILSSEAVYGMENCKWGTGSSIATLLTLPYTRNVLGSMEFTPTAYRVSSGSPATSGFMLAEAVVYESALQSFAQSAYNYPGYNGLSMIADVPTTWDESLLLEGYPGESVIRARRKGENWYLGAMTLKAKTYSVPLSFLGDGTYHAYIYSDNEAGDNIEIETRDVTSADTLNLPLLANGGCSIKFTKTDPIKTTIYDKFNYYEAEDSAYADLGGNAKVRVNNYASNLKCVESVGGGAGNTVTFKDIPAAEDGYYTLKVHYVSDYPKDLYIRINEDIPVKLTGLVANANDKSAVASKAVTVQLKKGANTICLYNDLNNAPEIDRIAVSKSKLVWTQAQATEDIKSITIENTTVEDDFKLPAFGPVNSAVITWTSNNPAVRIDQNGNAVVTQPEIGEKDVTVTLTPTVSYTGGKVSGADIKGADGKPCTFTITVKARVNLDELVLAEFSFDDLDDGLQGRNAVATFSGSNISISDDAKFGNSLSLGDKTYLDVKNTDGTALLKGKEEITISYYSKSEFGQTSKGSWTFFAARDGSKVSGNQDRHYVALLDAKNAVKAERFVGESGHYIETTGLANVWRKVDLVVTAGKTELYIDGVKKAESALGTQTLSDILGEDGGVLYIGKATWGGGEYYNGLIDEYKIYDKALTATEVKRAYAADQDKNPDTVDHQARVTEVLNSITLPTEADNTLTLPLTDSVYGTTIRWTSDNDAVKIGTAESGAKTVTATVTHGSTDVTVNLTATVTSGAGDKAKTESKVFSFTVTKPLDNGKSEQEEAKAALTTEISNTKSKVEKLKKTDYTDKSWNALQAAIAKAEAILKNPNAKATEINAVKAELEAAYKGLKKKVLIKNISFAAKTYKIAAGRKVTLKPKFTPANASNTSLKWSSNNKKYATVSSKGVVKTKKAGIGRTVTITAKAQDGSNKKQTVKIKIMKNAVTKITLKASSKTVKAGKKIKIKATVSANGKKANKTLEWKTSKSKYATVNKKGEVTAKKAGAGKTVTITATSTDGTNKKKSIKITIKK